MRGSLTLLLAATFAGTAIADPPPPGATLGIVQPPGQAVSVSLVVTVPGQPRPDQATDLRVALAFTFEVPPGAVSVYCSEGVWQFGLSLRPGHRGQLPAGEHPLDLMTLVQTLSWHRVTSLSVNVMQPDKPGFECSLPRCPFPNGATDMSWYRGDIRLDDPDPIVAVTFDHAPLFVVEMSDPWRLFTLALVPLLSLGWAGFVRRTARTAADAAPVGLAYWRFHHLHFLFTLVGWLAAVSLADAGPFADALLPGDEPGHRLLRWVALYLAVPIATSLLAQVVVGPVLQRLHENGWPGIEVYQLAGRLLSIPYMAGLCAIAGATTLMDDPRPSIALLVAAVVIYGLYGWLLRRTLDVEPATVFAGSLRDRVTELAAGFGVAVPQVGILPSGRTQMANAFAVPGQAVWLTDRLLQNFSRREVDAVVAHELAHLRQHGRRPTGGYQMNAWSWLACAVVVAFAVATVQSVDSLDVSQPWFGLARWLPLGIGVILVATKLSVNAQHRAHEYDADRLAVEHTGDAAGLITALCRLVRLSGTPFNYATWEEQFYTHPATAHRIAALARQGRLSAAQTAELMRPYDDQTDRYPIPPGAIDGARVFSTAFRRGLMSRLTWLYVAVVILTPTAVALLAGTVATSETMELSILCVGFAASFALLLIATNRVSAVALTRLANAMRDKFRAEGIDPDIADGVLVGIAPGTVPQLYESFSQWDIGYLFLGDRLTYAGEQARFALRPVHVTDLRRGPGVPGWFPTEYLYLTWRDAATGRAGTIHVWPCEGGRPWGQRTRLRAFADRISAWRDGAATGAAPTALASLGPPELDTMTGESPKVYGRPQVFFRNLLFFLPVAAAVCALVGVPFLSGQPASAWYVFAVVIGMLAVNLLPYWLWQEPAAPEVTVAPPTPAESSA